MMQVEESKELLLSPDTIERIYDIHVLMRQFEPAVQEIPKINLLLQNIANAQSTMALAAASMAKSIEKGEERYQKLEDRLQEVNDRASGKGQIPLLSHYATLISAVMVTILVVLYVHKQQLDASLTSVKVSTAP
jgi:hypothetical protein